MNELDIIDRKIIDRMFFNARISLSSLAKKLRISKQVVKYRIDQLMKKDIIQGFFAEINPSKIGSLIYMVYFNFQRMIPSKQKQFIEHLSKQKCIGLNVSLNGRWEHCMGILAESIIHFKKYYDEIMKDYEIYIKEKSMMIGLDFHYLKPRPIILTHDNYGWIIKAGFAREAIDGIDIAILSKLAENGRISLIDIAKGIKLTPNAVKQRIKNLEKKGIIIGYRAIVNYTKLGFLHYRIFLHLENANQNKLNGLMEFLKQQKSIISMSQTIGFCDLEFRALISHISEFFDLIEKIRNNFPEIIKGYDSIIYHQFYKSLNYIPYM